MVPLAFNVPVVSLCFSSVSVQWSEQISLPGCREVRGISETSRHGEDAERGGGGEDTGTGGDGGDAERNRRGEDAERGGHGEDAGRGV